MKTLRAVVTVEIYDDVAHRKVTYRAEEDEVYWNPVLGTVRVGVVKIDLPESWKEE